MSKTSLRPVSIFLALLLLFLVPANVKARDSLLPDSNLEAAVRLQLNLLQKPLEEADLLKLTSLYPQDPSKEIKSIEGLQYATHLSSLIIPGHDVQQLEPLHNLKSLSFLVVDGNKISNIEPLQSNTNLNRLLISRNEIENIEPLSNLTKLTDLHINNNQIKDLSPLRHVTSLETLYVGQNNINNIDVLLDLPNLKDVQLENNPLDENAASVINTLKARGVTVQTVKADAPKASGIRVNLDANTVPFNSPPFITNSTTLVQFRPIFDRLGLQISWEEKTQTIVGKKEGVQIQLQIDNPVALVNGTAITLPVAPTLVDGNTFVPVRFISESVDAKVEWDDKSRFVTIQTKRGFATNDGKFHFTAYGLWRDMADEAKSVETGQMDTDGAQLAIRYFNYTMLFIYSAPKSSEDLKSMKLVQYLDKVKQDRGITKETTIEEKQTKALGLDALQITYVNNNDWDKRIDTLMVFESDSHFYTILNSSYEVTYKSSSKEFLQILDSMTFHESK
ncbi:stalk domain-containing protein [Paenibacillus alba]|uniref:Stalk domain-containing protein n=1 Tax=Paenibacillus alba TaxID=1197127 RepID=A0ABU6GBM8_9BACL|nr:stalk domain-containing protein [Paenibacillus alba]MEC0231040.1 stalk domain-containing protein [Paenibacillus alba]